MFGRARQPLPFTGGMPTSAPASARGRPPASPPLTDDDKAQISRMRYEGMLVKEIAFQLGLTYGQVTHFTSKLARRELTPARVPGVRRSNNCHLSDLQKLAIRALHAKRVGQREIARRIGVAPSTVRTTIKRFQAASLGWPLPDGLTDAALEARLFPDAGTKRVTGVWSSQTGRASIAS